ncbi:MAG: phosphate ABC transporter permease family protein [Hyphomicrobiaceae bacterium]
MAQIFFLMLLAGTLATYFLGKSRAVAIAKGDLSALHSRPAYHGLFLGAVVLAPMLLIFVVGAPLASWFAKSNALSLLPADVQMDELKRGAALRDIVNIASGRYSGEATASLKKAAEVYASSTQIGNWTILGGAAIAGLVAMLLGLARIGKAFRARNHFERFLLVVLVMCATVAILTTIGIVFSVLTESWRFFFDPNIKGKPTMSEFLFGLEWNPQAALRADQGDIKTAFGFIPLLVGTLLITFIAICVAGPIGLFSAIYLSEYAGPKFRAFAKPILEILAGIPTVVLGFFAALTVAPLIRFYGSEIAYLFLVVAVPAMALAAMMLLVRRVAGADLARRVAQVAPWLVLVFAVFSLGRTYLQYGQLAPFKLDVASESALAAGLVMGMMIIPFISSLSDDVINSVPQSLRDGSLALGSTKSETITKVVLPAALPGIVSAFMLAISRAIGETMIVVMAAGLAANLTINPLQAVTTITVQIKTILVGDQEFDSAKTLAAFALGLVLFFVTLLLNVIALRVVKRYREQYD